MASHSDDESDLVSEETVRRTRSGRAVKVVAPIVSPAPRQTRGTKKKSASDAEADPVQIEEEAQPEVMEQQEIECTSDNSNGLSQFFPADELTPQFLEGASDSNQSGVPFPITEISQDFLNNTESNSQTPQIFTEKVFDASITEENANSFQSKMDVTSDDVVASEITQMNSDSNVANTGFDTLMEVTEVKEQEFNVEPAKVEEVSKVIIQEEVKSEVAVEVVVATPVAAVAVAVVEDKDKVAQVIEEVKQDPDTEMVSEDELPAPLKAKVPEDAEEVSDDELPAPKRPVPDDAEEVSDDELPVPKNPVPEDAEDLSDDDLPGPKLAELPDDTEVVSEDELPTVKAGTKRKLSDGGGGYDPGSPTGEEGGSGDAPDSSNAKRAALDPEAMHGDKKEKDREGSGDSKDGDKDKEKKVKSSKSTRKTLPDLDKYWKAVNDDPADFTGWTYLLQYVDQENEIDPAREAYDAFLAHYPYCYGYWRKYADYEKRKGNKKKCEDVFERGLKAIPLSVDLWLHFLSYTRASYPEEETRIREQFERALSACSLEFRSDRLWEAYIKWELEGKRLVNVMAIYDRLLATPTFGYTGHFDSFQELVASHEPADLVPSTVFVELRKEVRDKKKETPIDTEAPPGEDEADDHVQNDEERDAIRELIITIRRKIHKATATEVTSRWTFEEGIKRPYFHVKPLERCQLTNWKDYLEFEAAQGNRQRVLVLYERCLIACALYEEFWLKLIRYLESQHDPTLVGHTRDVFERACTVHHPDKPSLHLLWAAFEEGQGNYPKAAEILVNLEKTCPSLLQVAYRRINLERRKGDLEKCCQLFETYISSHKSKVIVGGLVIKYARFCHKIRGDLAKGLQVIKAGIEKDPGNARLYLQAIDLAMQREKIDAAEIVEFMDSFLAREPDVEQRILFAQRKLEFLEDFGTAEGLQDALRGLQQALSKSKGKKDKGESSPSKKPKDGSLSSGSNPPLPPSNYQNSGASNQSYGGSYNNSGNQGGPQQGSGGPYSSSYGPTGYNQQYPQSSGEYPPYQWGQYSQAPYNNYGQWGSYPNYY